MVSMASRITPRKKGPRMKKLLLSCTLLGLLAGGAEAGIVLSTSNPPGTPLTMAAGTTSGPMLVSVASDDPPADVMIAWNLSLEIVGEAGSTGTLTFQDPATGSPTAPAGYVFGGDGLGIAATNAGATLVANDFFDPSVGLGVPVPGGTGASLLSLDFLATSDASGLFGIYALEGTGQTEWTDANFNTQLFTDVPDGTGMIQIGEVLIPQSVPEPSALVLSGLAGVASAIGQWWRRRATGPARS